uniref:ShKT domain-containing protein n=1 Tax=Rhabditophanes sp. KR3021 TaxID=114890 RepID=A0AC35TZ80_9BILA
MRSLFILATFVLSTFSQIPPIVPINSPYGNYGPYSGYQGYSQNYPYSNRYQPNYNPYSSYGYSAINNYPNYQSSIASMGYGSGLSNYPATSQYGISPYTTSLSNYGSAGYNYPNNRFPYSPPQISPYPQTQISPFSSISQSNFNNQGLYGMSAFDNSYGSNSLANYNQPGVSLPPMGIADGSIGGSQLGGSSINCRDQSTQCSVWASTGQCSSQSLMMTRICPISCGTGCINSGPLGTSSNLNNINTLTGLNSIQTMSSLDGPSLGLNGNYEDFNQNSFLESPIGEVYNSWDSYNFDTTMTRLNNLYMNLYNNGQTSLIKPFSNFARITTIFPYSKLQCKDSHINGCPRWASIGLCERHPTYMHTYCKDSCNACGDMSPQNEVYARGSELAFTNNYYPPISPFSQLRSGIYPLKERKPESFDIPAIPITASQNNGIMKRQQQNFNSYKSLPNQQKSI